MEHLIYNKISYDIEKYKEKMIDLNFNVDAVMTGNKYAKIWTE